MPTDSASAHPDDQPAGRRTSSGSHTDPQETKPAEEWGERLDTGKRIARGGKEQGHVPGAQEQSE